MSLLSSGRVDHLSDATRKRLILIACILGSSIVFIDSTVVNVALPTIQDDLGGGLSLQQWVVDAYLLTLGSLILVGGSLGDIFGARRVFAIGVIAFGATSLGCALAPTGNALIEARALQGAAGALLTPAALATITASFEGEARGAAIGSWTAWTGIAILVGPLVGGWLVDVGAVLCTLGLAGPVFALIEQPHRGWSDPLIVATFVVGIVLLVLFVAWEARTEQPMLPLRLFERRNFTAANVETIAVYSGLATTGFFLALFVQQLAGYSALEAGLTFLPATAVMFVLSRRVGAWSMRIGPRLFMGLGPLVAAAGLLGLARLSPGFSYLRDALP